MTAFILIASNNNKIAYSEFLGSVAEKYSEPVVKIPRYYSQEIFPVSKLNGLRMGTIFGFSARQLSDIVRETIFSRFEYKLF